ncbi:MAG: transporter [Luteolibacter sp.]|jgi:hypothetical protein|nr:transporter [Luteolibacter sp.]
MFRKPTRKPLVAPLLLLTLASVVRAEEGGSGHYLPGSMSSFADAVPPAETFITRFNFVTYNGDFSKGQPLPIAGLTVLGVDAESTAAGLTMLWRPPVEIGEGWSYAMSATIPYVWLDVSGGATVGKLTKSISDSEDGLGDIVLMPLMLNYKACDDLNFNFRVAAYAPTGEYEVGQLANTGKNFWTIEPTVAVMYFGKENGIEASLFFGADFNFENEDTNYQSGAQLHLDGTLAQHFPLWGGLAGAGINGYWYEQVEGDSGSGANFGDFKGRTAGLGPVVSYVTKIGGQDVIAELKWLHEFETRKRLEGDLVWFKMLLKF